MVGDVRKVILRAGGLIVELVGAVGQLAGGVAAVGAVQAAVSVGGDVLAAHVELDIVELSLAVRGPGVLQEVDEVARGQLDGIVDADGVGDVFLDDVDDDVDVILDLVGLSAVGLFDLTVDLEGQGDGVLAGLGDRVEADLVHVGHLGLALIGRGDLGAAVIQRALVLGAGDGRGQDSVVKGNLILAGVVIAVIVRVILEEVLEVLLVEGHALARDNIVVDVVGLLRNRDRTGGGNAVIVEADNIESHGLAAVELGRGDGNGLVLLDGAFKVADLVAVEVVLIGGLAVAVIQIIVIVVGESDFLICGSAGHGVFDLTSRGDRDSDVDRIGLVVITGDSQFQISIADEACLRGKRQVSSAAKGNAGARLLFRVDVESAALTCSCGIVLNGNIAAALDVNTARQDLVSESFQIVIIKIQLVAVLDFAEAGAEQFTAHFDVDALIRALVHGRHCKRHITLILQGDSDTASARILVGKRHNAGLAIKAVRQAVDIVPRIIVRLFLKGCRNSLRCALLRQRHTLTGGSHIPAEVFLDDLVFAGRRHGGGRICRAVVFTLIDVASHSDIAVGLAGGGNGIGAACRLHVTAHSPTIARIINASSLCGQFQSATLEDLDYRVAVGNSCVIRLDGEGRRCLNSDRGGVRLRATHLGATDRSGYSVSSSFASIPLASFPALSKRSRGAVTLGNTVTAPLAGNLNIIGFTGVRPVTICTRFFLNLNSVFSGKDYLIAALDSGLIVCYRDSNGTRKLILGLKRRLGSSIRTRASAAARRTSLGAAVLAGVSIIAACGRSCGLNRGARILARFSAARLCRNDDQT